jgi:hypothetical protein
LRTLCEEWVSKHGIGNWDDEIGRAQEARVLELWPAHDPGSWRADPRGKLVRFFLDGRQSEVKGETLARSLETLSGVPEPILARAKLLAGDVEGSEELARRASDPTAAQWTAYIVELVRFHLKRGRSRQAESALELVPPGARQQCDVLLARRDVARELGNAGDVEILNRMIASVRMSSHSGEPNPGSSEAALTLCLDPAWAKRRVLVVEVEVVAPAVLTYGWDGGRSGTFPALEDSTIVRVPLGGFTGSRKFSVRPWAGGPLRQLRAAVTEPPA